MSDQSRRQYLLTVLLVISAFSYVDGEALGIVLQDIKIDLHLSDTQLGLLSGIAFALFYSIMGIPIARWADRGNRVTIIALTTALWSVMVALCGTAVSFAQLLLIRIGVGVGEAGCMPPAQSLIADYFNRAERARAVAIYMMGGSLSFIIGYFVAGWLNELYGWRAMFIMLGLPGLGVAALARFTLREPRLAGSTVAAVSRFAVTSPSRSASAALSSAQPSLKDVSRTLWTNATFRSLLFFCSVGSFFNTGVTQFQPAFLIRSYGLKTGELGTWFAVIYGLTGILGNYWGGAFASGRAAHNERLQFKAVAVAYSSLAISSAFIYLSNNRYVAFGLMGLGNLAAAMTNGPVFATLQTLMPPRMRATTIAVTYLFSNLIGFGFGPLAVGMLSDAFRRLLGDESLRYAMLALCPGYLWGAWHLWRASKTVARDLEGLQKVDVAVRSIS